MMDMEKPEILIIEDDNSIRNILVKLLSLEGYLVHSSENGLKGLDLVLSRDIRVVLTDVKLPDISGIELIQKIKEKNSIIEIVVLTAYGNISDAVQAMKYGAFDYLRKGEDDDKIPFIVGRALEKNKLTRRLKRLESRVKDLTDFDSLIGKSKTFVDALELAKKVANTNTTVLLLGETGSGKELFAQSIHHAGRRNMNSFVAINCAAVPKELQESEFFGHKKGAFTGANHDKKGLFEEANKGTLFLDEIGEMAPDLQAKLLRALETNTISRIGDTLPINVDVRIIAATNRIVKELIESGDFRKDLYYRLNTFQIEIPPLRERTDDIEILAKHFIELFCSRMDREQVTHDEHFMSKLKSYSWPGNIRELKNVIERAIILSENSILTENLLPKELLEYFMGDQIEKDHFSLEESEKNHILQILKKVNGNKQEAASVLKIGLTTLYRKLKEYGIEN